jgi:uncharacterized iron-regulated membrane protein
MKGIHLNKLHRYVGICIAPFLVVQTFSGLLLDFGLFRRGVTGAGGDEGAHLRNAADTLLVKIHFGPGIVSDCCHILLGMGVLWMAVSGWMLYLRLRRARKKGVNAPAQGGAA